MKTIKDVSEQFGMTSRTLRYYEELGLLSPQRSPNNQRLYPNRELVKLKLIQRGKQYGFNLEEIKEMILLFDVDRSGEKQLERTIEYGNRQMKSIDEKIVELQNMKEEMASLLEEFTEKLNSLKGRKE